MASIRKLFLDGLLIAIPLACLGILAVQVVKIFREIVKPLMAILPVDSVLGIGALTLLAVLAIVVLILLFGLIVRWKARGLVEAFERKVLNRIPIYTVLKRVSADVVDPDGADNALLVDLEGTGAQRLGVLVEDAGEHGTIVFLPDAPSATTGTVHVVPNDRIRVLKGGGLEVIDVLGNRGLGAAELLRGPPVSPNGANAPCPS